jgi:hypothetical protein
VVIPDAATGSAPPGPRKARPDDRLRGDPESGNGKNINVAGFWVRAFIAPRNDSKTLFQQPVRAFRVRENSALYIPGSALAVGGNDRADPLFGRQSLADEFRGPPLHRRQLDTLDGADLGEPLAAERDALAGVRGAPVTVGR